MDKKQQFSKSLQANEDYINNLTEKELKKEMTHFDNYEVEQCDICVVGKAFYCAAEHAKDPRCTKQCYDCQDEELGIYAK